MKERLPLILSSIHLAFSFSFSYINNSDKSDCFFVDHLNSCMMLNSDS